VTHDDAVRARFAATAARVAEHAARQVDEVRAQMVDFLSPSGGERVLDVGTGAGTLALALAPLVREVVAVDLVPELLEAARASAPPNVTFAEGDATHLPFGYGEFDLACSRRTIHHLARPELAISELARVTRPGGRVFVDDQIAPVDPLAALELNRFERARDPTHQRALSDADQRALFDANDLVLRRAEFDQQRRELESYLDLAGCEGESRERARGLAGGGSAYTTTVAWYLLAKPSI
jgi:ubiquinone/menaquinone biosynthesis C-methylase UbiE